MVSLRWSLLALAVCLAGCENGSPPASGDGGGDDGSEADVSPDTDSDGDTIPDVIEGAGDLDGDTITNPYDDDSDGDTIPDDEEAGDDDPTTPPADSDDDTIPDFEDLDSDDDTIADDEEAGDDDPETPPVDSDDDTIPDYLDDDSDGDTIADRFEGRDDTDGDTVPNYLDDDSDGDTIADAVEAGGAGPGLPPADTDGDTLPDFVDLDSDGDGSSDFREWAHPAGDPTDPAATVPEDDFVVLLPLRGPRIDEVVQFHTNIEIGDVFFLVDTTGSMWGEIDTIKSNLTSVIIPEIRARIPDAEIGVGYHDDFPTSPYGSGPDRAFELLQPMTFDAALAQDGVNRLSPHGGDDWAESQVESLYQIATGEGLGGWVPPYAGADCLGAPCFREGALPIVLMFTDSPFHNGPPGTVGETYTGIDPTPHTWVQAIDALAALHGKVIGLCSEGGGTDAAAWRDMEQTVVATDTVAVDGTPLMFDIGTDGGSLTTDVVDAIETLVTRVPLDVDAFAEDDQGDPLSIDATCFIRQLRPHRWISDAGVENDPAACAMMDDSTFFSVIPGTLVEFAVTFQNIDCFAGDDQYRRFLAWIIVRGNHVTYLDRHLVVVVVPPVR